MGQKNRRIFVSLLAGFLAFYLATMTVFTALELRTVVRYTLSAFNRQLSETAWEIQGCLESAEHAEYQGRKLTGQKEMTLAALQALDAAVDEAGYGEPAGIYLKASLCGGDGEPLLKSGNHLYVGDLWGYVDLDKWLTPEQIPQIARYLDSRAQLDGDMGVEYGLAVSGYVGRDEAQAVPTAIRLLERRGQARTRSEDDVWQMLEEGTLLPVGGVIELENPQTVEAAAYSFAPQGTAGMAAFETDRVQGSFEREIKTVSTTYLINGKPWEMRSRQSVFSRQARQRYALCGAVAEKTEFGGMGWSLDYSLHGLCVRAESVQEVAAMGEPLNLRFQGVFYPMERVAETLWPVWLFSFAMTVLLSLALYWMLARLWKKERLLEAGQRDLMNAVAHDLKTPLGIIRAYSEGLKENIAEEKRGHYLDVIIDETARMDKLLRELLELSRLEGGAAILPGDCDVAALLRDCAGRYAGLADVALSCPESWVIRADGGRMEQIFDNLLSNAVRYTPEGGHIYVTLEGNRVTVENEGSPIPADRLERIWEPFYKDGGPRDRGSGLGLAIVKKLAGLHGFDCGVENTERGVAFYIDFGGRDGVPGAAGGG